MKENKLTTIVEELALEELSAGERELVAAAKEATHASYAPYSHFHVGAALRLANGVVVKGANQENAAFAGICGERSAIYTAGANYPDVAIEAVAIAARNDTGYVDEPCSPCGVCRQAMLEFEVKGRRPIEVLLVGERCIYRVGSVASLLPLGFTAF